MDLSALRDLINRCTAEHSAVLIDLVVRGHAAKRVIEVYIDSEQDVTTDLCSQISRTLLARIEESRVLTGDYRLTVSSPGVERPLRYWWQFRKHVGRPVRLLVREAEGPRERSGEILGADEETVRIGPGDADLIRLADIVEARIPLPW